MAVVVRAIVRCSVAARMVLAEAVARAVDVNAVLDLRAVEVGRPAVEERHALVVAVAVLRPGMEVPALRAAISVLGVNAVVDPARGMRVGPVVPVAG